MAGYLSKLSLAAVVILLVVLTTGVTLAAPPKQGPGFIHYVDFGEDLYRIAEYYGVPVEALLLHNGLNGPTEIYVDMPLFIPVDGPGQSNCVVDHVVRPGETLSGIAIYYETTVWILQEHNGQLVYDQLVHTGQHICIPGQTGGYGPQPRPGYPTQQISMGQGAGPMSGYDNDDRPHQMYGDDDMRHPSHPDMNDGAKAGQQVPSQEKYPPGEAEKPGRDGQPSTGSADQIKPILPILPASDRPVEVVLTDQMSWMSEVSASVADPAGVTTLIVSVSGQISPTVQIQSGDFMMDGRLERSAEFGDKPRVVFRNIPIGEYDVWLQAGKQASAEETASTGLLSHKVRITVEAGKQVEVAFLMGHIEGKPILVGPDGWYLAAWYNPSKPGEHLGGWSNIRIHAPVANLRVSIESDGGGYQSWCVTGTKDGGGCDLPALGAGAYIVKIEGSSYAVKTYLDGNAYATLSFAQQKTASTEPQNQVEEAKSD